MRLCIVVEVFMFLHINRMNAILDVLRMQRKQCNCREVLLCIKDPYYKHVHERFKCFV